MNFFNNFTKEVIGSGVLLILVIIIRIITAKLVRRFGKTSHKLENKIILRLVNTNQTIFGYFLPDGTNESSRPPHQYDILSNLRYDFPAWSWDFYPYFAHTRF